MQLAPVVKHVSINQNDFLEYSLEQIIFFGLSKKVSKVVKLIIARVVNTPTPNEYSFSIYGRRM